MNKGVFALAAGMLALALIAGCMGGETQTTTTLAAGGSSQAALQTVVKVSDGPLGRILTDSAGRTLYVYTQDENARSKCVGECEKIWPPYAVKGQLVKGAQVTGQLTEITRADGSGQVAYVDMPLYYYSGDGSPGDVKGQGLNGVWFAINPDTGPLQNAPAEQGKGTPATTPEGPTTTAAVAAPEPNGQLIAKTADVPAGSSLDFTYNGDKAILVNIGGTYSAFVNKCPHKGCATAYDGNALTCPCHGSQFDPSTGDVLKGPAASPLTTIKVQVVQDGIYAK